MQRMTSTLPPASIALLCALALGVGCRAIESPEELQSLAGEMPAESAASGTTGGGDGGLDGFPLVGSAFPGLSGRLHSSLCDPASDSYGTCL